MLCQASESPALPFKKNKNSVRDVLLFYTIAMKFESNDGWRFKVAHFIWRKLAKFDQKG